MKVAGPSLIAAVAVMLSSSVRSQNAAGPATDSPYASIVARNMFGLVPIPVVDPKDNEPPPDPPPKITPNGIMNMFGKEEVLFKVAVKPKPGQPAKDDAHVLAVGEMEDEITVKQINRADGDVTVTFDNHGTIQELPLIASKESGGPAPTTGGSPGRTMPARFPFPNMPVPAGQPGGQPGGMNPFQGRPLPGGNPGFGNGASTSGQTTPNGLKFSGGTPVNSSGIYQPVDEAGITPEQSVILQEAQRAQYLQNGNERLANMLPPTAITKQIFGEGGDGARQQ